MVTGLFNANFPMGRLRTDVDRLLGCVLDGIPNSGATPTTARIHPSIKVSEDGESFHAELDIPGIKLEDVEVTVVGDELTIAGERKASDEARGFGSFRRVIGLPDEVDAEKVSATLNLGVLRITLPKAEAVKPRKIEVKQASV